MRQSRICKLFGEIPLEAARFARGKYPVFVAARNPPPLSQDVPVFMFHDVQQARFEAQLSYLRDNDYLTLTMAEFTAFLKGELRLKKPSVLLTFDDGHKSWRTIAFPLLRQYDFHGVGFLVTSFIRDHSDQDSPWLSWQEVIEIERSGVMTFESHTAFHDRVFVSPKLVDFYRPGCFSDPMGLDAPWIELNGKYTNRLPIGAPIYECAPRLAGLPRMPDAPDARAECVRFVAERGKAAFFQRRGWRRQLFDVWRSSTSNAAPPAIESAEEQRDSILRDLVLSRRTLEERLQREARLLCYPWGVGSELALAMSREAGYHGDFLVAGPRRNNRPGDSPWHVPRLKDDYIFRLPGRGRQSLASVFEYKLRRRAAGENLY